VRQWTDNFQMETTLSQSLKEKLDNLQSQRGLIDQAISKHWSELSSLFERRSDLDSRISKLMLEVSPPPVVPVRAGQLNDLQKRIVGVMSDALTKDESGALTSELDKLLGFL
jgi:hypothetical protein